MTVEDDEILLKRVPPGSQWLKAGPRLTNVNFQPRRQIGETAISVSRLQLTSPAELLRLIPDDVLQRLGPRSAWSVAQARAGDIRRLGFEVVTDPTSDDPGHALIQSGSRSLDNVYDRRVLAGHFKVVSVTLDESENEPA